MKPPCEQVLPVVRILVLVVVLGSCGCRSWQESRFRAGIKNKPAPDFKLKDLSGRTVRLSDFRGMPVVLAFWAYG